MSKTAYAEELNRFKLPQTQAEVQKIYKIVSSHDYKALEKLLKDGLHPDVSLGLEILNNYRGGNSSSPLTVLANQKLTKSTIPMMKLLLKYKANINLVLNLTHNNQPQTVMTVLGSGDCFDYKNELNYQIAKFLLDNGYDANTGKMNSGVWTTALSDHDSCGPIAELLLKGGADPIENRCTPYTSALQDYVDIGEEEGDLEMQEMGFPPHAYNVFRKYAIKRYGNGNPSFEPDDLCP